MNSYKITIIELCLAILANGVTANFCNKYFARHETLTSPFYYSYMFEKINITMVIKLKNASREITSAFLTVETETFESKYKIEGDEYTICGIEDYSRVIIDLLLYSPDGLCAVKQVADGAHVSTLEHGLADTTYEAHDCANVRDSACVIEVDLKNDCLERKSDPNANRNKSDVTPKRKISHTPRPTKGTSGTTRNASFTTEPTISNTQPTARNISNTHRNTSSTSNRKLYTAVKPIQGNRPNTSDNSTSKIIVAPKSTTPYTPKPTQNISDAAKWTHNITNAYNTSVTSDAPEASQNQSDTSNTVEFYGNDVDKYITITVASAVSVIALIVLVVVLRKCCWIKRDLSHLVANDQSGPFYLNMLFRKECDREIELVEQHHYEEINPQ
ncbi:hypothetical protein PYW08_010897 [Mythimna loreyi]|uniref:Uncharacterized protein n=1 Tax=Mythimna loreyi TaxID=667449 RepID=A0ACC2Q1Q7_9NEOP|nr:hypothetical protein PYW08_010897 [Mythimna loreyi]